MKYIKNSFTKLEKDSRKQETISSLSFDHSGKYGIA